LHGPAGRRTEITHSASEGVRRRMWSVLWVTLLLVILGFLDI
jgi:iron(III) transport system permease protein